MKLKTIALHLAYDLGSAAIGLAADKLRSVIVQRQNAPKSDESGGGYGIEGVSYGARNISGERLGTSLQEIRDPFEEGPIKVDARKKAKSSEGGIISGLGHIDGPIVCNADADSLYIDGKKVAAMHGTKADPFVKIDGETYIRNEYTPGKLDIERKLFIELTEDDVSAINYGVNAICRTNSQKGPTAVIKSEDLTKIYSILLKLQHKAAAT